MPNPSIICDIDGTLFNGESPIQEVIDYLKHESIDHDVIIVSGRQDSQMQATRDLLNAHDVPHSQIHLSDFPQGAEVQFKKYKAKKLMDEGYDIVQAIDNDARARDAYSSLGIEEVIDPAEIVKEYQTIEEAINAVDLKPTDAMAVEASRGLQWRQEFNRGGTAIGVARARDISNRVNLSNETVGRMVSFFARHEVDKQASGFSPGEDGYPSAGRIAWALWGGDPGKSWAETRLKQINAQSNQSKAMNYLSIENKVGKVKLNEAVTPYSIDTIIEEMGRLYGQNAIGTEIAGVTASADGALEEVIMEINSGGGSVLDGYRLYYAILAMRDRGVKVTAIINSLAASMASVIAMAADEIHMVKGGQIMIHDASLNSTGNSSDHLQVSQFLDGISDEIADIYAGKSGMGKEVIRKMMKSETWLNADKAFAMGLIEKVIGPKFDMPTKASMSILDKLLPNAELASKIEAKDSEIKSLEASISEAAAKFAMVETELQNAVTELISAKAELDEKTEALKEAKEKIAEQEVSITELTEKSEASAEKISLEASRLLSATGHPTHIEEIASDATAQVDHFAIMSKLSPEDRSDYYTKNRSKILSL
jgi:ATP-dependent protease ClpP protease subunit